MTAGDWEKCGKILVCERNGAKRWKLTSENGNRNKDWTVAGLGQFWGEAGTLPSPSPLLGLQYFV